jgi:hypothetical protein
VSPSHADSRVGEEKRLLVVIAITLDLRYEQAFLGRCCLSGIAPGSHSSSIAFLIFAFPNRFES